MNQAEFFQWIEDLSVTWRIHEDRNLSKLQTPLMHSLNSLPVENSGKRQNSPMFFSFSNLATYFSFFLFFQSNLYIFETNGMSETCEIDDWSICLTHEEPGIAELVWQPTIEEQKNISRSLNGKGEGVVGVLEVNYDVAREEDPCGEVVVITTI